MSEIVFRAWHKTERKMFYRAYQKWFHVLLCDDDGQASGKGIPKLRAGYDECILMQNTTFEDERGREIFEGDVIRIKTASGIYEGVVENVPDMFKSRKLHPLEPLFKRFGLSQNEAMRFEVIGNIYGP